MAVNPCKMKTQTLLAVSQFSQVNTCSNVQPETINDN